MSEMLSGDLTRRILVGVDLSTTGDHALLEAMRLCRALPGSELHVAYAIYVERDLHDARRIAQLADLLHARMDMLRAHVARVGRPVHGHPPFEQEIVFHVRLGEAAEALHQLAVDVDADLIVVGTHARRGMERLLLGSVAEALIRIARVPVLIAQPKDFAGLPRSPAPDPARPGEPLHGDGLTDRLHLEFVPRTTHISGLV
jgi:nucleotide-binding universal stress UspA family protein